MGFFASLKYKYVHEKVDLRKKIQILKIIVEEYIKTGDIVGSKSLLKKHEMGVSSATVRNDMASLEKMGLTIFSHTTQLVDCQRLVVYGFSSIA